jgi:hypothetical protein
MLSLPWRETWKVKDFLCMLGKGCPRWRLQNCLDSSIECHSGPLWVSGLNLILDLKPFFSHDCCLFDVRHGDHCICFSYYPVTTKAIYHRLSWCHPGRIGHRLVTQLSSSPLLMSTRNNYYQKQGHHWRCVGDHLSRNGSGDVVHPARDEQGQTWRYLSKTTCTVSHYNICYATLNSAVQALAK